MVLFSLLCFDLKGRQKNYKAQIDLVARFASVPGATAQHLFQMGLQAADATGAESLDVAIAAFRASLQLVMRAASPDYALASAINRKLINLADLKCKDGPEVFATYKVRIVVLFLQ